MSHSQEELVMKQEKSLVQFHFRFTKAAVPPLALPLLLRIESSLSQALSSSLFSLLLLAALGPVAALDPPPPPPPPPPPLC